MTVGLESHGTSRPEVAVGAIAVDAERLLLVRRGHGPAAGLWSVPGGRVEPGEMLVEAVVRELAEETGLEGVADRFDKHLAGLHPPARHRPEPGGRTVPAAHEQQAVGIDGDGPDSDFRPRGAVAFEADRHESLRR